MNNMKYVKLTLLGEQYLVRKDVLENMVEDYLLNGYDDEEVELDEDEIYEFDLRWKKLGE